MGVDRVKQARLRALKREYESSKMGDTKAVDDFFGILAKIVTQLTIMGEKLSEGDVIEDPRDFLVEVNPLSFQ